MLVHLYDVGPVLKQHVQQLGYMIVRVAYQVYTHAYNTLTVAQTC